MFKLKHKIVLYLQMFQHIPLANRVRGPYCKLRTEFFSFRFIAQARAGHKTKGKNEDPQLTVRTEKKKLVRYLLYLYCVSDGLRNDFYSRGTASNF